MSFERLLDELDKAESARDNRRELAQITKSMATSEARTARGWDDINRECDRMLRSTKRQAAEMRETQQQQRIKSAGGFRERLRKAFLAGEVTPQQACRLEHRLNSLAANL